MQPEIRVVHRGRLANKMFQAMVAMELKRRVPGASITGLELPEWALVSAPTENISPSLVLRGQRVNLDGAAWLLNSGVISAITVSCWGQRLDQLGPPARYRRIFQPKTTGVSIKDDQLLIHIRAEDTLTGWHSSYFPQPFSFYQYLINSSGLEPVFMGQLEDSSYTRLLRQRFPNATFLPLATPLEDFGTIRGARHIALSVSSFSWLASWLSENAETIHIPIAGLFNPVDSGTMLLSPRDRRYRFYHVEFPDMEARQRIPLEDWVSQARGVHALNNETVARIILASIKKPGVPRSQPTERNKQ
jgi:hypothetical protein